MPELEEVLKVIDRGIRIFSGVATQPLSAYMALGDPLDLRGPCRAQ